jgi:hypothetical protein
LPGKFQRRCEKDPPPRIMEDLQSAVPRVECGGPSLASMYPIYIEAEP